MPNTGRNHRKQTQRRLDVIKVVIEDVNLTAPQGPMAQGRDHNQWGLFDIDLAHGVGGAFPTPAVGEVWWIKRSVGSRWVLDHKVDPNRTPSAGSGGGGSGDGERAGVPSNVVLGFNVREKKTSLEYSAFVTFDAVTTDADGNADNPEHYLVDWVPCTKNGNIIVDEKVRQFTWSANDAAIDAIDDPAADYFVILPGNVERPKIWHWKGRVRAISSGNAKGAWSAWTDPVLPFRVALPQPPAPGNVALNFRWKDTAQQPIFSAVTRFDDVNYWDIPGYDYEDDVSSYQIQLEPLERDAAGTIGPFSGHLYKRADPNNDGTPWPIRRAEVKDKDADDTFVTLGTLAEDISEVDTTFTVDETAVVGTPAAPFIVLTNSGEEWLVTSRTGSGPIYTYEVYRQFNDTAFQSHSNGQALTWLKDPFVYHVDFHHIERPHTVYWRTRVRSKDRFNRLGPWSAYTEPASPWQSIDWQVPKPRDLKADIEIHTYRTHPQFKLVARFKDAAPNGFNLPGGDLQDDLDHYVVIGQAVIPDPDGYIEAKGEWYRVPDRKIGTLQALVNPADTSVSVTLDAGLPNSILRILDNPDKQSAYLRIQTGDVQQEILGNEVVAVTAVDAPTVGIHLPAGPDIKDLGTPEFTGQQLPQRADDQDVRTPSGALITGSPVDEPYTKNSGPVNTSDLTRTFTVERAQFGSGDHGHNTGDFVYLLTEHLHRATVDDKDKDDPGHFHLWYTVNLGHIPQPKNFYWRVKARSVDSFGHKSDWTDWTNPISPETDPDLIIDRPNYVRLGFDRVHRNRWTRYRAIVEFAEVHYTAPDGDREDDVTRYNVQLATSDGDRLDASISTSDTTIVVDERRKAPDAVPFFVLINDEVVEVTNRTNVSTSGAAYIVGADPYLTDLNLNEADPTLAGNQYRYEIVRAQKGTVAQPHLAGAHLFNYPYLHKALSAKEDDDRNNYNRIAFGRVHKHNFYKARVRAHDRYNRNSDWTNWTTTDSPSDTTPPPDPTDVLIDVDNHKVVVSWDYPIEPDEFDPDNMQTPLEEAAYFQIQLSTANNFSSILKFDRYVASTRKTFRVKKPGMGTYYVRVRAVDGAGNKSNWVVDSGAQNGVPTPDAPTITYDVIEATKRIRALVLLDPGVTGIDDDVDGYEFELQPAEFKRLQGGYRSTSTHLEVSGSADPPGTPFTAYIQQEEVRVTTVSGTDWTVTRGYDATLAAKHRHRAKVQFFRSSTKKRRRRTGEESEVDDPVLCIYGNIQRGLWYRARVRARNTKGLWSNWSSWS